MRALHVITSGELGGAQVHVNALVRALVAGGIEVDVACGSGEYLPAALDGVASVRRVPGLRRDPSPAGDPTALAFLARATRGYDVVHTHSAKAGALGRIGARLAGVSRIMHTSHGTFLGEPRAALATRALLEVERAAARMTTHLFVLSRGDLELMRSFGLYRETPWDLVRIAPERVSRPGGRWRAARRNTIVTVANHYPNKGLDVLLGAFAAVRVAVPDARLSLVGDGPERADLERRSSASHLDVEFLGQRADPTAVLLDASVFVLPSRKEGLPIALLEALALGVPCVATTVGAVTEIVGPGEAELVGSDDPVALARAIVTVLTDVGRGERLSEGGRAAAARFVASADVAPVLTAYTHRR